jgi:hypothetical protein
MEVFFVLFIIFLVFLIFRLVKTDRELIHQSAELKGWRVLSVWVETGRRSKNTGNWPQPGQKDGPRFYEVEYLDEEENKQRCLCKIDTSASVEWDV